MCKITKHRYIFLNLDIIIPTTNKTTIVVPFIASKTNG